MHQSLGNLPVTNRDMWYITLAFQATSAHKSTTIKYHDPHHLIGELRIVRKIKSSNVGEAVGPSGKTIIAG